MALKSFEDNDKIQRWNWKDFSSRGAAGYHSLPRNSGNLARLCWQEHYRPKVSWTHPWVHGKRSPDLETHWLQEVSIALQGSVAPVHAFFGCCLLKWGTVGDLDCKDGGGFVHPCLLQRVPSLDYNRWAQHNFHIDDDQSSYLSKQDWSNSLAFCIFFMWCSRSFVTAFRSSSDLSAGRMTSTKHTLSLVVLLIGFNGKGH